MRQWLAAARRRAWLPLVAAIVFAAAVAAGFQWGGDDGDAFIRVLDAPVGSDGAPAADLAGFVTETNTQGIVVRADAAPITVDFAADAEVELLEPITAPDITPGDWVVVGGRDDNVNSYILDGIIVIPADRAVTGDELAERYTRQAAR